MIFYEVRGVWRCSCAGMRPDYLVSGWMEGGYDSSGGMCTPLPHSREESP
jgi:hypothetical protein